MQSKGMMLTVGLLVGVVIVALFLVNGMPKPNNSGQVAAPTGTPSATAPADAQEATNDTNGVKAREVVVSGSEYKFNPTSLSFTEGETIKLVFKNTGLMPHDFVIDELGVRTKVISGGKEDTVTFTVGKKGTYMYYCSVGNHRKMGMEGTATVK